VPKQTKRELEKQKIRDELGIEAPKKPRKKRKPMTEEQRAAAIERLAKARAAKGPPKNSSIHPDVLSLPEDHPLAYNKVKEWLDYNKDHLKSIKHQAVSKDSKERQEFQTVQTYVKNLGTYIKDNVWCDHRYGKMMEHKMEWVTVVPAKTTGAK
jgi:hypothetical protein